MRRFKVVAVGGGSGIYTLLSSLRLLAVPATVTAIVSVSDSGGSSGILRDEFGILPPGDARKALLALSHLPLSQMIMRQLFDYRFVNGWGLKGHSFGNLFLTALTDILGREDRAISAAAKILRAKGKVYPVSLGKTTLCARLEDGSIIRGETNIDIRRVRPDLKILDVFLDPPVKIFSRARKAIEKADLIILGPGDLYTSLIPNLLVKGFDQAVKASRAKMLFVCNLMTKHGETDGFAASDFVREIRRYLPKSAFRLNRILAPAKADIPKELRRRYAQEKSFPVKVDVTKLKRLGMQVFQSDLAAAGQLWRHDPEKLSRSLKKYCR